MMMAIGWFDYTTAVVAIFASWSMYATLYGKPSPFRSWAENSFIGFTMGLNIVVTFWYVYNTGFAPIARGDWIPGVGIVLGILMVLRLIPRYSYISRLPIAISLGTNLGLSLRTRIFTAFISQVKSTIVPLYVPGDWYASLVNTTIVLCVILMLTFFLYTTEIKGPLRVTARFGEYALYVSFGAIFAQTFMGRLGLFVGYMQEITDPAWKIPYTLAFLVIILASILVMDRYGVLEKYSD
jgi:hypothetical protein